MVLLAKEQVAWHFPKVLMCTLDMAGKRIPRTSAQRPTQPHATTARPQLTHFALPCTPVWAVGHAWFTSPTSLLQSLGHLFPAPSLSSLLVPRFPPSLPVPHSRGSSVVSVPPVMSCILSPDGRLNAIAIWSYDLSAAIGSNGSSSCVLPPRPLPRTRALPARAWPCA